VLTATVSRLPFGPVTPHAEVTCQRPEALLAEPRGGHHANIQSNRLAGCRWNE
jgi:hypothetical protein